MNRSNCLNENSQHLYERIFSIIVLWFNFGFFNGWVWLIRRLCFVRIVPIVETNIIVWIAKLWRRHCLWSMWICRRLNNGILIWFIPDLFAFVLKTQPWCANPNEIRQLKNHKWKDVDRGLVFHLYADVNRQWRREHIITSVSIVFWYDVQNAYIAFLVRQHRTQLIIVKVVACARDTNIY